MSLDPRLTLARPDLADRALQGVVQALAYGDPMTHQGRAPASGIHRVPDAASEQMDQLLFGELFRVLEVKDGWAWGQAGRDGYVGFVRAPDLAPAGDPPTHRISAIRTYGFAEASIKSQAHGPFSLNSLLTVTAREGRLVQDQTGLWFTEGHLEPIGRIETDPVAVAERFLGAPYLWGGRESLGLDCSGLVQQALMTCGKACPRDTDLQQTLGEAVEPGSLQRGDLVFWKGHVALMLDDARMIHANAFHMATAIEPLAEARARYVSVGVGEPTAYRRP